MRALGGTLFASGALVLFMRKSSQGDWGDFALLLVLLVPCALLYLLGLGVAGGRGRPGAAGERFARPWQSVLLVFAVLLVPFVLFQFLEWVGGNTEDELNTAWIFALTAALAALAALRAGVSYATLLAVAAIVIAWIALCDKVFGDPSGTTVRWLLIVIAVIMLAGAAALRRTRPREAVEVVTGAGIAAVAAGLVGIVGIAFGLVGQAFGQALGGAESIRGVEQHLEWDLYLLVVSAALIAYGPRTHLRGPSYVGALGLFLFILSVGTELSTLGAGDEAEGKLVGWPLVLLLLGAAALAAGFLALRDRPTAAGGGGRAAPGAATSGAGPGGPPPA